MRKRPKRFRKAFQPRFADLVRSGVKCQTIRPYPKRACDMPYPGDMIVPFQWLGRPYGKGVKTEPLLGDDGVLIKLVASVLIEKHRIFSESEQTELDTFSIAKADGFASWAEMAAWFENTHGLPFKGILIRW